MASPSLPVLTGDKDQLLQQALGRLAASPKPGGPEADPIVTASRRLPAVAATYAPFPPEADPRLLTALAARGHRAALHAPGRGVRARARRPQRRHRSRRRRRARRSATTRRSSTRSSRIRPPRALYLFPTKALAQDQLAELHALTELIAQRARGLREALEGERRRAQCRGRSRDRRLHLRRRHAVRRAARDPRQGPRRPQQSRHAALGHPAAPSAVGEAVREPEVRDHRRAACLSRRVRQPPVEHPAAPAARLPPLRIRSDLHLLVGDDRQSARAGGRADRPAVRVDRAERRAARREVLPLRQSAGGQRAARHPPLVPHGIAPRRARVPEAQPAADPVRAEPPRDRDPDDLSEGCLSAGRRAPPT